MINGRRKSQIVFVTLAINLITSLLVNAENIATIGITKMDIIKMSTDGSGIVRVRTHSSIFLICSSNVSILEANVLCRHMGLGLAKNLKGYPIPTDIQEVLRMDNPRCFGNEEFLEDCVKEASFQPSNNCTTSMVVGVRCVRALPNLVPDINSVESSVYVQTEPLYQLTCAIEERCLSPDAIKKYKGLSQDQLYGLNDSEKQWRKLLRFSTIIKNDGEAVFEPHSPTSDWEWHSCHGHFHSMSTFAIYQIFAIGTTSLSDRNGLLLAGHKASFCLEDNVCKDGVRPFYRCSRVKTEKGTQGISPGCSDTYLHNIDCQWVDVTDLPYGRYIFRMVVNPEILVAESNYHDNGVACELFHFSSYTGLHYCHLVHPMTMW